MKIAIVGGAGVRVPLLVGGLARSDLAPMDFALYDVDQTRLAVVAALAHRVAEGAHITAHTRPEPCLDGADFVIASIRAGGIGRRARDEAAAIAHGTIGQETGGPAGFAMAVRTIPDMVRYAQIAERLAPQSWLINFSNPVSIVTQAVAQESGARIVGICDTPSELFEDAAHALDLSASTCAFDYFGLNHLGWLREIYAAGQPQMDRLWADPDRAARVYRTPLFEIDRLLRLRLLPTEYVYYYYRPADALENLRRARTSRGSVVSTLTGELFADLAAGRGGDPVQRYLRYLADRDSSYMQIESGTAAPRVKPAWVELSGYDRIALMTMRAIARDTRDVIALDVANRGNLPFLQGDDIVEVPCVVDRNGPRALHVAPVPDHCADLIARVKAYERATIQAALSGSRDDRIRALQLNPLAGAADLPSLIDALTAS